MKTRLEAIANVTVIVVALALGYVVLGRYVSEYRARPVTPGDRLAAIPNLDWSQHRRTLVLVLNTGCHFCQQSVPFYQKLASAQPAARDDLALVAVFPNDPDTVLHFLTREDLRIRSVSAVALDRLRVDATPTIILVNSDGRVERAWIGALTPSEELDVLKATSALPGCSSGEFAAVQAGAKGSCASVTKVRAKN